MIRLLTRKNRELYTQGELEFSCAQDLADSEHIYIITDIKLLSLNCQLNNTKFNFFNIINETITNVDQVNLSNVEYIEQSNLFIYKINIVFEPNENDEKAILKLNINDSEYLINLIGYVEKIDERLMVTIQNLKQFISDDYMLAFRESISNSSAMDTKLYNRKIREYLMNISDLSTLKGSYKNLFAAIDYFGYGDLLSLKEYWTDGSTYKSTNIGPEILQYIDKTLAGFKKTNMIGLTYQINEQQGVDEDGLPIFINVLENTDEILIKLEALKKILEKEFIDIKTHIVDITGEFQSVVGHELYTHLVNSNEIAIVGNSKFDFDFVSKDIEIINHKVIVNPWLFNKSISFIKTDNSDHQEDYFLIEKEVGNEMEEYQFMTQYLSADFGMLEIKTNIDKSKYQLIEFTLFGETDGIVFESGLMPIDNLVYDNKFLLGIKKEGNYKISFSCVDHYGGRSYFGTPDYVKVGYKELRVKLGVYAEEGDYNDMTAWTTFKSRSGHLVPSIVSTTLDINTWNLKTNIPEITIAREYASDYDMLSTYTSLNSLNNIELNNLKNIPLISWATTYTVAIIDVIRNDDSAGFYIATNETFKPVEYFVGSEINEEVTITKLCSLINSSELSGIFNADITYYSNDPEATINNSRPMLRLTSKEIGMPSRMVKIYTVSEKYSDFEKHYVINDIPVFSNVDAKLEFSVDTEMSQNIGNLEIWYGDEYFVSEDLYILNNTEIYNEIKNLLPDIYSFMTDETVVIYSEKDIKISHISIGIQENIVRAKNLSKIITTHSGTDIQIGKPVFACIDNARKTEMGDITWKLINPLNGDILSTQNAFAFRWVFNRPGVYSLKVEFTHGNVDYDFNIDGFIIIKEF